MKKEITKVTRTVFRASRNPLVSLKSVRFVIPDADGCGFTIVSEALVKEKKLFVREKDSATVLHTMVVTILKELIPSGYRVVPLARSEGGFAFLDINQNSGTITILVRRD